MTEHTHYSIYRRKLGLEWWYYISNLALVVSCLSHLGQVTKDESLWDLSFLISKKKDILTQYFSRPYFVLEVHLSFTIFFSFTWCNSETLESYLGGLWRSVPWCWASLVLNHVCHLPGSKPAGFSLQFSPPTSFSGAGLYIKHFVGRNDRFLNSIDRSCIVRLFIQVKVCQTLLYTLRKCFAYFEPDFVTVILNTHIHIRTLC